MNERRRFSTVATDDGTTLAVHESGRLDAGLTVVFVHGHCLRMESWFDVRDELEQSWGADVRMVFYDHRGHGASGSADAESYTIDTLGRDLGAVVRAVVPTGRYVIVGHSMGGMTTMSYARQHLGEVGERLVGVGLVATASSGLAEEGLGVCLAHPLLAMFQSAVRRAPSIMAITKRMSRGCAPPSSGLPGADPAASDRGSSRWRQRCSTTPPSSQWQDSSVHCTTSTRGKALLPWPSYRPSCCVGPRT
ncbi:alpha/beta fold hydrolase [Rhodococcus sp. 1163]|uniref:alpha/beta fold hydrolase n=1 Tax=Rhodococcus sp. 1163 TaxID=1905289 RepID=UPI00211A239E|nr:alpha/beta fold hydrolase [Rhodococcus sp. 1163]